MGTSCYFGAAANVCSKSKPDCVPIRVTAQCGIFIVIRKRFCEIGRPTQIPPLPRRLACCVLLSLLLLLSSRPAQNFYFKQNLVFFSFAASFAILFGCIMSVREFCVGAPPPPPSSPLRCRVVIFVTRRKFLNLRF